MRLLYCLVVGGGGWFWLLFSLLAGSAALWQRDPAGLALPWALLLFGALGLIIDFLGFRVHPYESHSMTSVVLITATLALGPLPAALIAAFEGLFFSMLLPFIYKNPRNLYSLFGRPLLRSGTRIIGILGGAALATALNGQFPSEGATPWVLLASTIGCYVLAVQLSRIGREYLQGGWSGLQTWWRVAWRLSLGIESAPLPLAALWAAIYSQLGPGYFVLAGLAMIAAGATVRRAAKSLQIQRRSVRELARLNEVSRAIIRSELNVDALCDLIYREASKIVDTSSFHIGLFDGTTYTLMVRVQDRVRLPRLTINLKEGDGLIGWMRQTGRALLVENFPEEMDKLPARPRYQSEHPPLSGIYVPLIAGEAVIGSISIQSYQVSAFDANDLRLLSLIADQAAVAIARARAYNDARQRAIQLQAIHEVSERITAILNLEELLPSVVRLIRERFHYHPVHIFTVEPGSHLIKFRASTAETVFRKRTHEVNIPMGIGIVGNAAASGQPILVGDVSTDSRYITDTIATRSELAVPLRIGEQVIGVLDVQSDKMNDFDGDDLFIMRTLADQIAIAIDSANSYTGQQEEAWTLNALLQVAENIGQATTLEELLPTVVRLPPLLIGCDRCYCLLWDREHEDFELYAAYGLSHKQREQLVGQRFHLAAAPLLARVYAESQNDGSTPSRSVYLSHTQHHSTALPPLTTLYESGTLIALPILARTSLLGILLMDYNIPDYVPEPRQVALYTGAIGQIASALESALLAREAVEAAYLEQELRVAREIQTALLPATLPCIPGWEISADWRSARLVGGDFYDFWFFKPRNQVMAIGNLAEAPANMQPFASKQNLMGFVIADVSDKGVPAAMFMALARSLVRAAALDGSTPSRALERANRWIARDSESGMFVTLFYAVLEIDTGLLYYSCAGHNPPLIFHQATQTFEQLATPGIALGVLEEVDLHEATATLDPGDLLLCYTDGLTEAINEESEEFGMERLRRLLRQRHAEGAPVVLEAINEAVTGFTRGRPPFDDMTMMVIRRVPPN
jgi:serine phosphatase RsbU (regulator of sigma subunit)/putative methionine-R-sulfoxide reductase with GAF domain